MTSQPSAGGSPAIAPRNDRLLRALGCEPVDHTPVWFMRQAGRSLPEYRAIKECYSLLEICRQPELCAEVTLQPVRRLGVDAAILYADIMHPLVGVGIDLEIVENVGPVIAHPIRTLEDTRSLRPLDVRADLPFVLEDIACVLDELRGEVPLIGFSGAPFTLASYLVEGRPSRNFAQTKRLMYGSLEVWDDLMRRLADIVATYLLAQAEAGVHALQLFDSWAGALSLDDYCRYVQPYSRAVIQRVSAAGIPLIHFGTSTGALLEAMRDAGSSAIGVDWRIPLDVAWERVGHYRAVQGNLDPIVLLSPWEIVRRESEAILRRAGGRPGHVFNVGHGLHPQTPPDQLERLVAFIHDSTIAADR
ncbi:MAG TPA: uroporphyrinogen decarboxylase [Chloroflexota bacterium]